MPQDHPVPAIADKYTKDQSLNVMVSNGYNNGTLSGDGAYVLYNRLGACNHISFTVKTAGNSDKFGISVVRATDSKKYYTMVVNPENDNPRKVIYTDNSVLVMYINDNVCYTNRIYGITKNCWSINNYGGSITVSDVKVKAQ